MNKEEREFLHKFSIEAFLPGMTDEKRMAWIEQYDIKSFFPAIIQDKEFKRMFEDMNKEPVDGYCINGKKFTNIKDAVREYKRVQDEMNAKRNKKI